MAFLLRLKVFGKPIAINLSFLDKIYKKILALKNLKSLTFSDLFLKNIEVVNFFTKFQLLYILEKIK